MVERCLEYPQSKIDQRRLINTDWDILIILDACRYDYFKLVNSIDGKLISAYSPASCTVEWLKKVFPGYYNVTYISANPIINSAGVPIKGYIAKKHFKKIVDVWKYGWDEELSTVHPRNVNKFAYENLDNKMIIHYIQPHGPWIGKTKLTLKGWRINVENPVFPDTSIMKNLKSGKVKIETLRKAYIENLKLVLKYVSELINVLPYNKIIITSDHGELLGENNMFLHPCDMENEVLRVVPWFIIK